MSTIYIESGKSNLIQDGSPTGAFATIYGGKWANVPTRLGPPGTLAFLDGGGIQWANALIDSGKAITSVTVAPLLPVEVNAICSKLDMMFRAPEFQDLANNVAEEILNILFAIGSVKYQTQSTFGGILAQGNQLDIWPLRPKDVGGALLNPAATATKGLYAGTSAGVYTWYTTGLTGGTGANIVPSQTMWQYAGMIYLGGIEYIQVPKMAGIQFTLAGIAAPPQPVTRSYKKVWGSSFDIAYTRLEKPVIIPPLKQQLVEVMPDVTGDSDFELVGLVIAAAQNKSL